VRLSESAQLVDRLSPLHGTLNAGGARYCPGARYPKLLSDRVVALELD
jgi:hypothetical protein